jgi:hypothetical protein
MFFSLSSAIVMVTCGKEGWEWVVRKGDVFQGKIGRESIQDESTGHA